jgi:hypothetical protein
MKKKKKSCIIIVTSTVLWGQIWAKEKISLPALHLYTEQQHATDDFFSSPLFFRFLFGFFFGVVDSCFSGENFDSTVRTKVETLCA